MTALAAKKNLIELIDESITGAFQVDPETDPLLQHIARVCAAGPYRGLRVFDGGAAAIPAQSLPPRRPRRRRPLW
jgi:hypothetical protein